MARVQPETRLVKRLREELHAAGWLTYKIHGSQYQEPGIPDLLCFRDGRTLAIEAKQPGKDPTPVQLRQHRRLTAAGVTVLVIRSVDELRDAITGIYSDAGGAALQG